MITEYVAFLTCQVFILPLQSICSTWMDWFGWWTAGCSTARTHRLDLKDIAICRRQGAPRYMKHADSGFDE